MFNKKVVFVFLIFCVLLTTVNAIQVTDLSDQIDQGNQEIISNNAKILGDVSQLKEQIRLLQVSNDQLNEDVWKKKDAGVIAKIIDIQMFKWQQQLLIMFLVLILFSFLGLFFAKAKGVI